MTSILIAGAMGVIFGILIVIAGVWSREDRPQRHPEDADNDTQQRRVDSVRGTLEQYRKEAKL